MKALPRGTVHGLLFLIVLTLLVHALSLVPFLHDLRLSPMVLGVIVGMILANTVRSQFPESWDDGLKIASKQILRAGIVLYGFRLSFDTLLAVGGGAILIDVIIVAGTLILGNYLGRALGLDKDERLLISSGSAICGAAAVLATEPVVGAKPHKTVVAVATVVLFGTLSMFGYPLLYRAGLLDALSPQAVGVYTGSTIHEVAHVVGAGAAMTPDIQSSSVDIAGIATMTKMLRVLMLAPVLMILGYIMRRGSADSATSGKIQVPWFAFYFLIAIGINTLLGMGAEHIGQVPAYHQLTHIIEVIDGFMLAMAMTAIGLDATFAKFRQSGAKAFLLALGLCVWLVGGGYILARLLA
ncbi:MAG: YeiH family putative sulfate export transporter [Porphyromonadaceae bacterium]|nr:YeiH family putative sulfate export transporter [Porphyromonadaceae bacterium]